ncbi:winged helix-turn-helix transcriptional regulator [Streptomyces sp. NBC_01217]|uniref:winged helix-turn-helix transcriptional regulator n=1 Tax=Streptomyces sp. NBC_01217 TaxID=2903779 RepID=UPI002E150812|nr:helix-turn-helix transcriptional regulator [Streptomyces sp. NBC_01217]
MPQRQDWSNYPCPVARSVNIVGDPWAVRIMCEAMVGVRRFDDFRARLRVADNVLSRRLHQLVESGLLRRSVYRGRQRTHHEYLLTEAGADLLPVLNALAVWGEKHTAAPGPEGHLAIVHSECGQVSTRAEVCSNCGHNLVAANTSWLRRWKTTEPVAVQSAS